MARKSTSADERPWKRKMGVEFSGLERPRDFLIALGLLLGLVVVAAVIAAIAFG